MRPVGGLINSPIGELPGGPCKTDMGSSYMLLLGTFTPPLHLFLVLIASITYGYGILPGRLTIARVFMP